MSSVSRSFNGIVGSYYDYEGGGHDLASRVNNIFQWTQWSESLHQITPCARK